MRRLLQHAWVAGLLVAGPLPAARADISWFNGATNLVYYADGITPLFGFKGDSAISCFVQLIFAGGDNAIDQAFAAGDGTTDDDQVVALGYIGENLPGTAGSTSHYGRVNGGTFIDDVAGGYYYVRVWSAPSPDFGNGDIPTSLTNFYGNSELFLAQAGFEPPSPPQDFNFGGASGFSTTLVAAPEPSVAATALVGLLAWLWRRRRPID